MKAQRDLTSIRKLIAEHKRWDAIFALFGFACLMIGVLTFLALFVDMAVKGLPRLTLDFFINYPSRHAAQAGILSAWVGSTLVMVVTALVAVPLGVAQPRPGTRVERAARGGDRGVGVGGRAQGHLGPGLAGEGVHAREAGAVDGVDLLPVDDVTEALQLRHGSLLGRRRGRHVRRW